jgi:hypothetical protein
MLTSRHSTINLKPLLILTGLRVHAAESNAPHGSWASGQVVLGANGPSSLIYLGTLPRFVGYRQISLSLWHIV